MKKEDKDYLMRQFVPIEKCGCEGRICQAHKFRGSEDFLELMRRFLDTAYKMGQENSPQGKIRELQSVKRFTSKDDWDITDFEFWIADKIKKYKKELTTTTSNTKEI